MSRGSWRGPSRQTNAKAARLPFRQIPLVRHAPRATFDRRASMTCFSFDFLNRDSGTASGFRRFIRCHYPAPSPNVSIMTPTRSQTLSFPEVPPFEIEFRRQCPRCLHKGEPVVVPRGCTFGDVAMAEKASLVRLRFQPHPI